MSWNHFFLIWKGDDIILKPMVGNDEYYFCSLNFVNVGMLQWFYDLECNSRLWIVTHIYDIWAEILKLLWCLNDPKGIDGYYLSHMLQVLGCLGDFMILIAILDYELLLIYDIWA
jgi:hypothetical protein